MTPEKLAEWREGAERDQRSGFGLGWPGVVIALIDALEDASASWASYAAEQERHAETERRLEAMFARHEIERALRAVNVHDEVASDEDIIFHDGAMHAVRIIRDMLGLDDA